MVLQDEIAPPLKLAPPPQRKKRGDAGTATLFLGPTLGGFALFTLFPIVAALLVAFTNWPLMGSPEFNGVDNFVKLFNDAGFIRAVQNTLLFVIVYLPLNLTLSLALAAWISPRIRGASAYRVLLFIPVVTPMVANAAAWTMMLIPNGVIDGFWYSTFGAHAPNFLGTPATSMLSVLVLSLWQGLGYNMLIFTAALQSVPTSMLDSASIDGAGTARKFFSIKLPVISPWIFFASTLTLISSFQVFTQPFVLTGGGPGNSSTTIVMFVYRQGFQFFNLGYAAAGGLLLLIMIFIVTGITFLVQKKWVHYD